MIQNLIELSIRNRAVVVIGFVFIALLSIFSLKTARIDAIPDIGENQQIVFTEWAGRSPKDIEEQVTYPLSVMMQGIPGVKNIRATSAFGFSIIYVIFKDEVDFYWSRSRVLEKLSTASSELPSGVTPNMGPDATGLGQIFWYTLENEKGASKPKSLAELRSIQDFYVRYLLQGVEGVSEVASIGGFVKEYQIDVDPNKLFAYDVHFSKLIKSIQNSNIDVGAEVVCGTFAHGAVKITDAADHRVRVHDVPELVVDDIREARRVLAAGSPHLSRPVEVHGPPVREGVAGAV